jgi:protein SCO1
LEFSQRTEQRAEGVVTWLTRALLLALLIAAPAHGHDAPHNQRLPVIGPAPDFALISQDRARVSLRDLRGKVVAVAFIFASCTDVCPMLTDNMVRVQKSLGDAFGPKIAFVSITVDPEHDTPEVLKQYAESFDANRKGWWFLTGDPAIVHEVGMKYGVVAMKSANGDVDHTLLTSIIDPNGILRVQYMGAGFDLEEFRGDLVDLLDEDR